MREYDGDIRFICLEAQTLGKKQSSFKVLLIAQIGHGHLPSLHCTVIGFALDWEPHKSLKHDRECLTELLERPYFQRYPIQRIQLADSLTVLLISVARPIGHG